MSRARSVIHLALLFLLLGCASLSHAWSRQLHSDIADAAFLRLSPDAQQYYLNLLQAAPVANMSFTDLSPWVDSIRSQPVFEVFNGQLPQALKIMGRQHSSNWHWTNSYLVRERDAGACEVRNRGRLEEAIVALDAALKEPLTAEQEVRTLAMLMHFLEDAHQPLHSMTLVRNNCKIDAGGNGFCVQKMSSNCVMNLHQLWDSGFSNSKDARLFNQLAIKPASSLPLQTELGLILAENQSHAATIYATDEGRMPHRDYMAAGTDITRSRLDAAVNRIYHLLDKHWRYKTQG